MMRFNILIIIAIIICGNIDVIAQCCGAGNPILSGNGESNLNKGTLQLFFDYMGSRSDNYYEGSHISDIEFPGKIDASGYNFLSLGVGYGITRNLTVQANMGYYINKYENYKSDLFPNINANGFGDLSLTANYAVYKNLRKGISIAPFITVKFPVGKFDCVSDGVKLPIAMQPSSGSFKYSGGIFAWWRPFSKWYFTTYDFFEYSQLIKSKNFNYQYGPLSYVSLSGNCHIIEPLDVGLIFSYENKGRAKSDGRVLHGTKYQQIKLTPALYYKFIPNMQISAQFGIPVWRDVEMIQMANSWNMQFSIIYNLKIF